MRSLGPFSLATLRSTGGVEPRYFPTTFDKRSRPSIRITTTITTTTTTMTATGVSPSIVAERKKGKSARTGNDVRALSVRSIGFDRSIDHEISNRVQRILGKKNSTLFALHVSTEGGTRRSYEIFRRVSRLRCFQMYFLLATFNPFPFARFLLFSPFFFFFFFFS